MQGRADQMTAIVQVRDFRNAIERSLKRFAPARYLPLAASTLREVHSSRENMIAWYPPHFILHSMEANCAYHRAYLDDNLTDKVFNRLMNTYKQYSDPAVHHTLTARNGTDDVVFDAEQFFMVTARHQFTPQRNLGSHDVARGVFLFIRHSLKETETQFQSRFGFSFSEWMDFCLAIAAIPEHNVPVITPEYFKSPILGFIRPGMITPALGLLSRTVKELGHEFLELRSSHQPLVDWQIPSLLPERPLVDVGNQQYVVTHIPYVLCRSIEGLYDICRDNFAVAFGAEFGSSFSRYVGLLLAELPEPIRILPEGVLSKRVTGPVCDYLVATDDSVLLVECKAVENSSLFLTEPSIRRNNATAKITDGFQQVANVANVVKEGKLADLIGDVGSRQVVAIVVTYREIPLANGEFYWSVFSEKLSANPEALRGINSLGWRPQVLDVRTLEKLVCTVRTGQAVTSLFSDKLSQRLFDVGEWETYLDQFFVTKPALPLLDQVFETKRAEFLSKANVSELGHTPTR